MLLLTRHYVKPVSLFEELLFKWQVRRESNPQHPVLETGALPIGATDLESLNEHVSHNPLILFPYAEYEFCRICNIF
jgi:hypothetical protein